MNLLKSNLLMKDKNFFLYWVSQLISSLGNSLIPVTITFAVLEVTGSATSLGIVLGALWISRVVFVMFGGVWADRLSRKHIIIIADLFQGFNHLIISLAFFTNLIEIWHLAISALFYGAISAFHAPASSGFLPEIIEKHQLQKANSLLSITSSIFDIAGPALAGLLVIFLGFSTIFIIDAITFFVSFFLVLFVTPKFKSKQSQQTPYWQDLKEGVKVAKNHSWIWTTLISFSIFNFAVAAINVLGPLALSESLRGPKEWGLILTAGSIGGLLGGIISHNLKPKHPLKFSFVLMAIFIILELLVLIGPLSTWIIMIVFMLASASIILGAVFWDTIVQQHVPEHLISRIGSLDSFVSFIFMPVGFVIAGPLSAKIGLNSTLITIATLVLISNVWVIYFGDGRKIQFNENSKVNESTS
ncbi:MFS transporter [Peribacillus sp. NPDC096622]|uniref:MFS transporter n=1 Tax=Peribacillus sp. NPDC096622 TaxID=3364396 RepID=UPI00382CF474